MNNFIKQLTSTSYWVINKDLCKVIGLENTLLLQHFIDLQYKLFGGYEFFQQQERIQEELNFTEYQVKKCTKFLLKNNLITVIKKGNPAKNFYSINELEVVNIINSSSPDKLGEFHLTSETNFTSHIKELNIKELKEKDLSASNNKSKQQAASNKSKQQAANIDTTVTQLIGFKYNTNTTAETDAGQDINTNTYQESVKELERTNREKAIKKAEATSNSYSKIGEILSRAAETDAGQDINTNTYQHTKRSYNYLDANGNPI